MPATEARNGRVGGRFGPVRKPIGRSAVGARACRPLARPARFVTLPLLRRNFIAGCDDFATW
jgi:hypothetical protein